VPEFLLVIDSPALMTSYKPRSPEGELVFSVAWPSVRKNPEPI